MLRVVVLGLALFLFCGIARARTPVLVSIPPQKFLVENIAGNLVAVSVLLRPGADPHIWEPGPEQMRAVSASGLWFTIGLPFEEVLIPRPVRGGRAAPSGFHAFRPAPSFLRTRA